MMYQQECASESTRRVRAVYQIKKADKMQSFKTLVEAVEVLNQQ